MQRTRQCECFICLLNWSMGNAVISELCMAFAHKQPKLAAAAVNCTCELLRAFGSQVISVKMIGKQLAAIFGNPDKNVRAEATQLTVEMYRWIGAAINAFLGDIKPIQSKSSKNCSPRKHLDNADQQSTFVPPKHAPRMLLFKQHNHAPWNPRLLPEVIKPVDAFDLVDPVDVLSSLPADFDTLVTSLELEGAQGSSHCIAVCPEGTKDHGWSLWGADRSSLEEGRGCECLGRRRGCKLLGGIDHWIEGFVRTLSINRLACPPREMQGKEDKRGGCTSGSTQCTLLVHTNI